ncbi:unnamed protein product [Leptidea sinapis]|uniref:Uncharacterized protein n=1 Tax=Leptidea sinapis TaxID=189913 RepID=A0A5E4Q6C4_9NEOP|nr:unnamed protein product [Leptidea sinapis]
MIVKYLQALPSMFIIQPASLPVNYIPPKIFNADKPFYFEIRANRTPLFNEFEVVDRIISVNFSFKLPKIFEANRPFFFNIRADGTPLFSGVKYN